MPLYEVPCWKRFIKLDPQSTISKVTCLHVDEVGLFVYYDKKEQLDHAYIRRHLVGKGKVSCFIEADDVGGAIKKFFSEYQESSVGGKEEEAKALWINREEPILELPPCQLIHKNKEGQFICGEEQGKDGNGVFGMCTLEHYDAPDDCPVVDFYGNIHKMKSKGISMIGGYKVILSAAYRS